MMTGSKTLDKIFETFMCERCVRPPARKDYPFYAKAHNEMLSEFQTNHTTTPIACDSNGTTWKKKLKFKRPVFFH